MSEVLKIFVGVTPTYWLIVCDPPATSKPFTSGETPAAYNGARPLLALMIEVPRVARSIFLLNESSLARDLLVLFFDMKLMVARSKDRHNVYSSNPLTFFRVFLSMIN